MREALDLPITAVDKIWQAIHILDRSHIERALTRTVARAVEEIVKECGIPQVYKWAAAWLDGTDRTAKSARITSYCTDWEYLPNCIWAAEDLATWLEMTAKVPEEPDHSKAWSCVTYLSYSAGYEKEGMFEGILEDFKATIEEE